MANTGRCRAGLGERAVPMVAGRERGRGSRWEAICWVAHRLGPSAESIRLWMRRAEIGAGVRDEMAAAGRAGVMVLERENQGCAARTTS